jgi:uncharacterized protein YndB with AHSA1/START domain
MSVVAPVWNALQIVVFSFDIPNKIRMKKLSYKISILAPAEKVWESLWNEHTYAAWTSPFGEGSAIDIKDWKEGGRVHFIAAGGHGMYSDIVKMTANKYISFRHLGEVKDGQELPIDEKTREWSGWMENYTLTESNGQTALLVEVDMHEKDAGFMDEAFPKALDKLKEISEL